jgi:hypothetical protein
MSRIEADEITHGGHPRRYDRPADQTQTRLPGLIVVCSVGFGSVVSRSQMRGTWKTGIVAHWIKKWRSFRESRHSRRTSLPFMESHTMKGIRTMLRAADSQLIEARQNLEFSLMASLAQK